MCYYFGQYRVEIGRQEQSRYRERAKKQVGVPEDPQHAQVPRAYGTKLRASVNACMNAFVTIKRLLIMG
jgi:hypothetical protein